MQSNSEIISDIYYSVFTNIVVTGHNINRRSSTTVIVLDLLDYEYYAIGTHA